MIKVCVKVHCFCELRQQQNCADARPGAHNASAPTRQGGLRIGNLYDVVGGQSAQRRGDHAPTKNPVFVSQVDGTVLHEIFILELSWDESGKLIVELRSLESPSHGDATSRSNTKGLVFAGRRCFFHDFSPPWEEGRNCGLQATPDLFLNIYECPPRSAISPWISVEAT